MKANNSTTSTIDAQTFALAKAVRDQHSVTPLTGPELEAVAAAGSKPGASGGSGVSVKRPQ